MITWHTEKRKITELKNWEDNPRTITEEEYKKLEASVKELGNFEPLVINVDGTVIAGNQRLRLAVASGDVDIEVSVPHRKLTAKEVDKIGIVSNTHSGQWDTDKLANNFEDILNELGLENLAGKLVDSVLEKNEPTQHPQILVTLPDVETLQSFTERLDSLLVDFIDVKYKLKGVKA